MFSKSDESFLPLTLFSQTVLRKRMPLVLLVPTCRRLKEREGRQDEGCMFHLFASQSGFLFA